ncbi:MAG TPA: mechanosensitive ion channel family protein [Alphaproteobacteria bacterium]|nr:mechanosensitive ion channel family protein [Alphaproteobacteria bacterium]
MESPPFDLLESLAPRAELLVYSALILAGGLLLATLAETGVRRLIRRAQGYHVHVSLEATLALTRLVRILVFALAVIVMLNFWGLGLSGIWSGALGLIAGIGVALIATWAMVSNVTGALFLAIWRPYRLGDTFEVLPEGTKGRAIDRNLMFTVLQQEDGAIVSIPNNLIFQRVVRCYPAAVHGETEDMPSLPAAKPHK